MSSSCSQSSLTKYLIGDDNVHLGEGSNQPGQRPLEALTLGLLAGLQA